MTLSLHLPRQAQPAVMTPVVFDETAYAVAMHQFDTLTALADAYRTGHLPGSSFEYLTGISTEGIVSSIWQVIKKAIKWILDLIASMFYRLANLLSGKKYENELTALKNKAADLDKRLAQSEVDKGEQAKGEGIILSSDFNSRIGYSSKENERAFHYDPDTRPVLLVSEGQDISNLESVPAIRRQPRKA